MGNYLRKKINEEKAAVSVLIIVTVLTFVVILLGAYLTVTTLKKSQINSDMRIQEIYGEDVERVNEIYEELIANYKEGPTCDIETNVVGTKINYKLTFSENIKELNIEDIKLFSGTAITTNFGNGVTLSSSYPAYSTTLSENKSYAVTFDYNCISDTQEFEIGLYSDTIENLPTKKLIANTEIQHEEYIIEANNSSAQFKILAQIQASNNISISNFSMIEISNDTVNKESLIKDNPKNYTLVAEYDENKRYVIVVDKGICTDENDNKNQGKIKII